jgi:hypothetical protein
MGRQVVGVKEQSTLHSWNVERLKLFERLINTTTNSQDHKKAGKLFVSLGHVTGASRCAVLATATIKVPTVFKGIGSVL